MVFSLPAQGQAWQGCQQGSAPLAVLRLPKKITMHANFAGHIYGYIHHCEEHLALHLDIFDVGWRVEDVAIDVFLEVMRHPVTLE